jgi:phage terminase large subunit GpA-like protein
MTYVSSAEQIANDRARARQITYEICESVFAPPPTLTVSEWADKYRRLSSKSSAEPGRYETGRIPYLRKIQDTLGDTIVPEVVCAKSAQVGLSTVSENYIGHVMHQDPSGILVVWPTEKALRNWSTLRLQELIDLTPELASKFPQSGRRTSDDAIERKIFDGGYLAALSAKSTTDLRSYSARRATGEEIDEWDADVSEQGDPIELMRARIRTFWNGKLFLISTPTRAESSRIWRELESSTWDEFWVPCPHCGATQTLRWIDEEKYGHKKPGTYRLLFERDAAGELIPGSCRYLCEHCNEEITERFKQQMLEHGDWVSRFPERYPAKVGFHINTLYSPLVSWDKMAEAWIRAVKDPSQMVTFVNTWLGLPFEESADAIDEHFLRRRAKAFPRGAGPDDILLPRGVGLLTGFTDVQADRLEMFLWGWGAQERAWAYKWETIDGDPDQPDVWRILDERLTRLWPHEDGAALPIAAMAIDAGYLTERVWNFCEARAKRRAYPNTRQIFATVGRDGRGRKLIEAPTRDRVHKAQKNKKRPMHIIGVDTGKDMLNGRLRLTDETAAGYINFSDALDPAFYEQITAERLATRYIRKRPVRVWELKRGRRNEALDGAVGSLAALYSIDAGVRAQIEALALRVTQQGQSLKSSGVPAGSGNAAPIIPTRRRRMHSRGVE